MSARCISLTIGAVRSGNALDNWVGEWILARTDEFPAGLTGQSHITGRSISSGARAQESEARYIFLQNGFSHGSSLQCMLEPSGAALASG
jgi:hypothetical protein